jgi:hypothetical protein
MADVEINDILRIGAVLELEETFEIANVYHVLVTGGGPIGFAAAALDVAEYMDLIYANLTARMSETVLPNNLTMQNVTKTTTFGAFAWGAWAGGTAQFGVTAPGVSVFTWARTLKPRVQLRKYYGVFTEDDVSAGKWSSALALNCKDAMTDHITSFTGTEGLQMLGVAYNRTLGTHTNALSTDSSREPAYQRRRKRGRGS